MNRKIRYELFFITLIFNMVLILSSCQKEKFGNTVPFIKFDTTAVYLHRDTSLAMGSVMTFKIVANSDNVPVSNFVISLNNGVRQVFLDTGIYNNHFEYTLKIIKGSSDFEKWTFFVMNKDRKKDSVSLTIHLLTGGQFGNIKQYHIILGSQNNADTGSFFSFESEQIYNLEQAYNAQSLTDMDYYYHQTDYSTLSSPNDNDMPTYFTGTYGISNWQVRNESRYNPTTLTSNDFDQITNDSLIIVSYDVINAKRKAKNIKSGDVWAFKIASGKLGLIKVNSTYGTTDGSADISIKIQE